MLKLKAKVLLIAAMSSLCLHAAEVAPGDYEQSPAGTNLGLLYYQYATTDQAYAQGDKVADDYTLETNIGILRLVHVYGLSDRVTVDPQFLLPFGRVAGTDQASNLGSTSGFGDLILAAPLRYRLNDDKDVLAAALYLTVPSGEYDKNKALNLGGNRWKYDVQAAYVKHFNQQWAMDLVADVIWYGSNDDYGSTSANLQQKVSYETQIMGRYMPNPSTSFGVGLGHNWGGETKINGIKQDNQLKTTNIRFSASKFFSSRDQFQLQLGQDLKVDTGTKEDFRMNLRYLHVF